MSWRIQKLYLVLVILTAVLAGCSNDGPIDTSNPVSFKHRTGVFSLQVPGSWKTTQDQIPTESIAAFADPTQRAEIIAYAGLLDHRLAGDEGLSIAADLTANLLNHPTDLQIIDKQRQSGGAFLVTFGFTRSNVKRSGQAVFRDDDLALAGVIVNGPEQGWADLQKALQPYVDSFKVDATFVQGTYFEPIGDSGYALVVPADWPPRKRGAGTEVKSRDGQLSILTAQQEMSATLKMPALADQAATTLRQSFGLNATLSNSEQLPDGRVKVTLDRPDRRTIGYVEQKDGLFVGLFFDMPSAHVDAYQAFIDFIYSTYITGKS